MTTSENILSQLRTTIRDEIREEVRRELIANLGGPRSVAVPKKFASVKKPAKPAGSRAKRSPEEMSALMTRVLETVKTNPGAGAEFIKTALGLTLADIELPIKKLLKSKTIKKRGIKRATKYYPAS